MKKLIFALIVIAAIIIYKQGNIMNHSNSANSPNTQPVKLHGEVAGNISILGNSAYKLVNVADTTKAYYIIGNDKAPAIGEILSISVHKKELVILNNDTMAVYMETDNK